MSETLGEMLDTSPAQRARYYALLRALSPEQRARSVVGLTRATRIMALAGIRQAFPSATERELDVRLAVRLYGPQLAQRVYGYVPDGAR